MNKYNLYVTYDKSRKTHILRIVDEVGKPDFLKGEQLVAKHPGEGKASMEWCTSIGREIESNFKTYSFPVEWK